MRDAQAIRFWTAFVALAALNIAGWAWMRSSTAQENSQPLVRLTRAGGSQEFGGQGRLPLQFDRDLFEETAVGMTLVHSPFDIDPPTAGRWQVRARNEIAFEPLAPPRPGHIYRVRMQEEHPIFRRFKIGGIDLPEIHYERLELESASITSIVPNPQAEAPATLVELTLEFNAPVAPADLATAAMITVNGEQAQLTHPTKETGTRHKLEVAATTGARIRLTLEPELATPGAVLGLGAPLARTFQVQQGLLPTRASAYAFRSEDADIDLYFNRRLDPTQKTPQIKITPPVKGVQVSIQWNSIQLRGNFTPETTYEVEVQPPLVGKHKSHLSSAFTRYVTIPKRPKHLGFKHSIGRLATDGALGLDLQHGGITEAVIHVHRLPERNIPIYLAGLRSPGQLERLGEHIAERMVVLDDAGTNEYRSSLIELADLIERTPGIYLVSVESTNDRWHSDTALVLVGDLSLHVQRDEEGMLAWATSLTSGEPVEGARVVAWSPNRRRLVEMTTDENGLARLDVPEDVSTELITCQWDRDLAFVEPQAARTIEDRALAGAAWKHGVDVMLYPERGVHRPGETLRLSGLLRNSTGETLPPIPLTIRVLRPDGRIAHEQSVTPTVQQGLFHLEVPTRADAPTGKWTVSCHLPGKKEAITSLACQVMPFVPVRVAVETSVQEPDPKEPDAFAVRVDARYLHGGPAAALEARTNTTFEPTRYTNKDYPEYRFENPPSTRKVRRQEEGRLDENGSTTLRFKKPEEPATWFTTVESSVLEAGGRATTTRRYTRVDTALQHLGASARGGKLHHPGTPIEVDAVLLDASGALDPDTPVTARLMTVAHEWMLHEHGRRYTWRSQEVTRPVLGTEPLVSIDSEGARLLRIPGLTRGAYRLELSADVTTSIDFHVSSDSALGRMSADRPDRLELIAEAGEVLPGSTTSVLVRSPFPGLALVTVETDRILSTQLVRITEDGVRVAIDVPDTVRDTCFVGATVIRPIDPTRTEWLPVRAKGAIRLDIDESPHRLAPSILASDGARPGEMVHVTLALGEQEHDPDRAPAMAHVWAVEEGALLTTDFHVPDPMDSFFQDRRRVVRWVDTNSELLPDYARPASMARIGGDARSGYRAPVPVRLRETEVLWQEHVPLDADGILELELTMPQLDGAMRIMAVVVDGDRYGSVEHTIGVVAPLEIAATFPRTAAPGDRMEIPVRIQNRTAEAVEADIRINLDSGLEGALDYSRVFLQPGSETTLSLEMTAGTPGQASVRIEAIPVVRTVRIPVRTLEGTIAVRPPHGRRREVLRMRVPGGSEQALERDHRLEAFAGHVEVLLGETPAVDINPALEGLIDYPYGCGEQTGSRVEGLLAAERLPEENLIVSKPEIATMITVGLDRLHALQGFEGGVGYWPGEHGNPWVTMRTGLIVLKALDQAHEVPPALTMGILHTARMIGRPESNAPDPLLASMACRILAHADEPDEALMLTLASRKNDLDLETRVHLAEAFFALGLEEKADNLIDDLTLPNPRLPSTSGRFVSDLSQIALAVDLLLRRRPEHPMIPELVDALVLGQGDSGWRTTYESAAALSALASWYLVQPEPRPIAGTIELAGKMLEYGPGLPTRHEFDVLPSAASPEMVRNTGAGTAHVVLVTSGVPLQQEDDTAIERGLAIERRWLDFKGEQIPPGTALHSGDLVVVELEIRSLAGATVENVAISEVLPGGMEFELPSLATSASAAEVELTEVDHVEFHDDRLLAFTSIPTKGATIRYVARAIVPGTWVVPGTDALAMYDARLHAHGASNTVEILAP